MTIEFSPRDRVFHEPDNAISYYSDIELDALQFEFDGVDVESLIHDLWEWCYRKRIPEADRKRAVYGAIRKQHDKAKLFNAMRAPTGSKPSSELLNSKLVKSSRQPERKTG